MDEKKEEVSFQMLDKFRRDIRAAVLHFTPGEVRYLVDYYYQMQDARIRAEGQERAAEKAGEPNALVSWLAENNHRIENNIKSALHLYAKNSPTGKWSLGITGIGPVIAAGLLAHIDILKAPTAGHIWRFAGLDPTVTWNKGQKRPWNADLKVLCWKIGESFVKQSGRESDIYGHVYLKRKDRERKFNVEGRYLDQAVARAKTIGKNTEEYPWYAGCFTVEDFLAVCENPKHKPEPKEPGSPGTVPLLSPGRIHARSKRYAVKLFLAHWHHVAYVNQFGKEPPLPYPIAIGGHSEDHYIAPPHFPFGTVGEAQL